MFTSANMIGEPKITYNFVTPTDNDEADINLYESAELEAGRGLR